MESGGILGISGPPNNISSSSSNNTRVTITTIVFVVTECLLMLVITVGNSLVMVAMARYPRLRTATNYLLLSLAVADLCVGLSLPLHIVLYLIPSLLDNVYVCLTRYACLICFCGVSIFSLLLVMFDRYVAMRHASHYAKLRSPCRTGVLVAATWVVSILYACLPYTGWNKWHTHKICHFEHVQTRGYSYILVVTFFTTAGVTSGVYLHMYCLVRRQLHKVSPSVSVGPNTRLILRREMQLTRMFITLQCVFLACWLPFMIITIVEFETSPERGGAIDTFSTVAVFIAILNSAINPVIYHFQSKAFRSAFRGLVGVRARREATSVFLESYTVSAAVATTPSVPSTEEGRDGRSSPHTHGLFRLVPCPAATSRKRRLNQAFSYTVTVVE